MVKPTKEMASFFPQPEAGESIYSLFGRYHILSGNKSLKKSIQQFTEHPDSQVHAEFPTFLPTLAEKTGIPLSRLINEMTPYPFYRPFLPTDKATEIELALQSGETSALQSRIGAIAGRFSPGKHLYYCPICVAEDFETKGFPTFKMTHQLLGMTDCTKHGVLLITSPKRRKIIITPATRQIKTSTEQSLNISSIIENIYHLSTLPLEINRRQNTYITRLNELSMTTPLNRLRLKQFRTLLLEFLFPVKDMHPFNRLVDDIGKHYFPESLFYNQSALHHPVKHVILIGALFGSWSNMLFRYFSIPHEDKAHNKSTEHTKVDNSAAKTKALRLLKTGSSLRRASQYSHLSVNTIKVLAARNRIPIAVRPKKIYKVVERSIWRQLMMGKPTQDIALDHEISVGAVEQIMNQHPYLKELRRNIRFYEQRNIYRDELLTTLKTQPNLKRNEIRSDHNAMYSWLYKHDNLWLYASMPPAIPRQKRNKFSSG